MKRKAIHIALATAVALTTLGITGVMAGPQIKREITPNLVPVPTDDYYGYAPEVRVWTRDGDGATLYPGETVQIFFRTNRDAYVAVYNIDTRGRARLLFPANRWDDGFVRGKKKVRLPGRRAGYKLMVSGPAGIERIVAIASDEPIAYRWRAFADEDLFHAGHVREPRFKSRISGGFSVAKGNLHLSGAFKSKPQLVRKQLIPVPRDHYGSEVSRDETWFRVARRGRCGF